MLLLTVVVLLCCILHSVMSLPPELHIAALIDSGKDEDIQAFQGAIDEINSNYECLPKTTLSGTPIKIYPKDSFKASQEVCRLMRMRPVAAVLGPQTSQTTSLHIQSLSSRLQVPHLQARWSYPAVHKYQGWRPPGQTFSVNLYPNAPELNKAYVSLIREWATQQFVVIYEDNDGLVRLQDVLTQFQPPAYKLFLAQLPNDHGLDFRPFLKTIKRAILRHLVIDCRSELVRPILDQANEIGMISEYYSFMFTTLDLHLVDLGPYHRQQGRVNITGLRLLQEDWLQDHDCVRNSPSWQSDIGRHSTTSALVYDAVHLYIRAVRDVDAEQPISVPTLDCKRQDQWGRNGSLIMEHMLQGAGAPAQSRGPTAARGAAMRGRSGLIELSRDGQRQNFQLEVLELSASGLQKVGTWSRQNGVNYTRTWGQKKDEIAFSMANRTFRVIVAKANPYVMAANDSNGEPTFIGFCIEMMEAIARKKNFTVEFYHSFQNTYGTYNEKTGPTGMIKELMENRADMAIADLSITLERERGVDFSMPWMNLGISILYRKPVKPPPQLFSFMGPLSAEVWIYMGTAYLGVSVLLFILARLAPEEWDNPNPCIEDPDVLENQFSLLNSLWFTIGSLMQQGTEIAPKLSPSEWQEPSVCSMAGAAPDFEENEMNLRNSFWFTIGSLMQQGCDINPKAISTRMVATWWWIFTLIMISSYTANLAAFLTAGRMETPIKSAEDLSKQTTIKYGCLKTGASKFFFRDSDKEHYRRMYNFMETERPTVYVDSSSEGVERVTKGNYAFLMESSSIEYVLERNCDLTQIGGLLDHKSYGIALQPGSPYTPVINSAILEIQEEGTLLELKNRWWKVTDEDKICKKERGGNANDLGIDNVGGVFVVLIAGMGFSVLIAIGEFVWKSRKLAHSEHTTLIREMAKELRFAMSCGGSTKPMTKHEPIQPVSYGGQQDDYVTYSGDRN